MSLIALLILGLAVVPAFGLAILGWLALAGEDEDMGSVVGFEGMPVERHGTKGAA